MQISFYKNLVFQKNSAVALFLAFSVISFLPSGEVSAARMQEITSGNVTALTNMERSAVGAQHLTYNSLLAQAAQAKLDDMFTRHYFAHTSPVGVTPWYWFGEMDYTYEFAGENLAMQFSDVHAQHNAWMKSTTHRQNILNPRYSEIGVAVGRGVINGKQTTAVVQLFATPQGAVVPLASDVGTLNQHVALAPIPSVQGVQDVSTQPAFSWASLPYETILAWSAIVFITIIAFVLEIVLVKRRFLPHNLHIEHA